MSLLSSPQGTPERVWSVVAGLHAIGGEADRATFDALLNPGYFKDGDEIRAKESLATDASSAATSLQLIRIERDRVTLGEGLDVVDFAALADHVHTHLASLPADDIEATSLEAYAWLAAESDRLGNLGWLYEWTQKEFAEKAGKYGRSGSGYKGSVNSTNITAWRRWLTYLGLGVPLPLANTADFPVPTIRVARELERSGLPDDAELSAEEFLALLARRMPYLDRGWMFIQACQRVGHQPSARQISPLLSVALRDLHDEGIIRFQLAGDAATQIRLTPDPAHRVQAFTSVKFGPVASL